MRWMGHVARMGEMRNENLKGRDYSEDGKILLEWISGT
jgi:hypothetical protein